MEMTSWRDQAYLAKTSLQRQSVQLEHTAKTKTKLDIFSSYTLKNKKKQVK